MVGDPNLGSHGNVPVQKSMICVMILDMFYLYFTQSLKRLIRYSD